MDIFRGIGGEGGGARGARGFSLLRSVQEKKVGLARTNTPTIEDRLLKIDVIEAQT